MTEITSEQFEKYISEMQNIGAMFGKFLQNADRERKRNPQQQQQRANNQTNNQGNARLNKLFTDEAARAKLRDDLDAKRSSSFERSTTAMTSSVNRVSSSLKYLDGNAQSLGNALLHATKNFTGLAVVGSIIEGLVEVGEHWTKHYRELSEVGQTFNGSMVDMARQAAESGMSLSNFTTYVKKNSAIMNAYGTQDVTKFAKNVRKMTRDVGNYGYSVDELNDLSATWLDIQRVQGNRYAAANGQNELAVKEMAGQISGLSAAFGTSRDEILKTTKEMATSGATLTAELIDPSLKMNKAFQTAQMTVGAMGDGFGKQMQGLIQKQMLYHDIWMDSSFTTLQKAGVNASGIMREFEKTVRENGESTTAGKEATLKASYEMASQISRNAEQIKSQSYGDPAILDLVKNAQELTSVSLEERLTKMRKSEEDAKKMEPLTKIMLTLGDRLQELQGDVLAGLLKAFAGFQGELDGLTKTQSWANFRKNAEELGLALGKVARGFFNWLSKVDFKSLEANFLLLGERLLQFGSLVFRGTKRMIDIISNLSEAVGGMKHLLLIIAGFGALKKSISRLFSSRIGSMNVNAGTVYINGKALGDVGGSPVGGGHEEEGGRRRNRRGAPEESHSRPRGRGLGGALGGILAQVGLAVGTAAVTEAIAEHFAGEDDTPTKDKEYDYKTDGKFLQGLQKIDDTNQEGNEIARRQEKIAASARDQMDANFNSYMMNADGSATVFRDGVPQLPEQALQPATNPPPPVQPDSAKPVPPDQSDKPGILKSVLSALFDPMTIMTTLGYGAAFAGAKHLELGSDGRKAARAEKLAASETAAKNKLIAEKARQKALLQDPKVTTRQLEASERKVNRLRADHERATAKVKENEKGISSFSKAAKWMMKKTGTEKPVMNAIRAAGKTEAGKFVSSATKIIGKHLGPISKVVGKGLTRFGGLPIDMAFEGLGYGFGGENRKAFTAHNLAKSGLKVTLGAAGGLLGGGLIGGTLGYYGGELAGNYLFGEDDDLVSDKKGFWGKSPAQAQKNNKPQPAIVANTEAQKQVIANTQKSAEALQNGLPSPDEKMSQDRWNTEVIKILQKSTSIQEGILSRLWKEGYQLHDIYTLLDKLPKAAV